MPGNPNLISGLINGPGLDGTIIGGFNPNGTKTTKPITFLGGTVLGFNATLGIGPLEESSLSVELLNDCKVDSDPTSPQGDYFLGEINIGSPVFFDLGEATSYELNRAAHEQAVDNGKEYFKFGGILQSYTAQQNSGGLTFSARVVDPRSLLSGVVVVVGNTLTGPIKHRNYYNVYAYYEYGVLKPDRREPQPLVGYTIFGTLEIDVPVIFDPRLEDTVNCNVFGTAFSDERGMRYDKVIEAIRNMNPLVYAGNYAETFFPTLEGRDDTVARARHTLKHQNNIFKIDLSELPVPPLYYRVTGPNTTLLDIINDVCEATGHIFHVTLEESPNPNQLHTIKVKVANIKKLIQNNPNAIKSEILAYNGRSTDLSYGKELSNQNTRTLMIGEQKHEMYETINIEPFFGEDKYGNPITPLRDENGDLVLMAEDGPAKDCGWMIEIYLDDLNYSLRCPLYDYIEDNENLVVSRKVRLSEYHIRTAYSGFERWKKFVFNPNNKEDMSRIIQRNFPDLTREAFKSLYDNFLRLRESSIEAAEADPQDQVDIPAPEVVDDGPAKLLADNMAAWDARLLQALDAKRRDALESVFNYISQLARTHYGKDYLAAVSQHMCVADAGYMDLNLIAADGTEIQKYYTVYRDPCAPLGADNKTVIDNKLWQPRIYTHIPTNEGAWIEQCGSVLGFGGVQSENSYLDFFRTEDGRVQPMARFDSKVLSTILRKEGLVDDKLFFPARGASNEKAASVYDGVYDDTAWASDLIEGDIEEILFASGVCGDLNTSDWSLDQYVQIRVRGNCPPPSDDIDPNDAVDFPSTIWSKCSVGDKIYLYPSGCIRYSDISYEETYFTGDACCGKWQSDDSNKDCYWDPTNGPIPEKQLFSDSDDCVQYVTIETEKIVCSGVVKIPISFDSPCFTKYCDDQNQLEMTAAELEQLFGSASGVLGEEEPPISYDPYGGDLRKKDGTMVPTTSRFCYKPNPTGIALISSVLDFNSTNNQKMTPTAFIPTAVAIPVKSNIEAYGPWKSAGFDVGSGGIEVIQDVDFCPWVFDSAARMDTFAQEVINDRAFNKTEIETGSIVYPNFPDKRLGFIANGPNLTNINVSMGSNGVTTTYSYRTYTPKFGGLKSLEKEALTKNLELTNRIRKLSREKQRKIDTINSRLKDGGRFIPDNLNSTLNKSGTLHRIILGETYPLGIIHKEKEGGGYEIVSTGNRTVVGTETLQKSVLELTYGYSKKAFMSWDGLFSPVSISGDGGFPRFIVADSGVPSAGVLINNQFLNPLTNPCSWHHHSGVAAGHAVDVVGRDSSPPSGSIIMNMYTQSNWDKRYSDDYRFIGLKGPLVLHSWGYDTDGMPIPNENDNISDIKSGVYTEDTAPRFYPNWLQQPTTWPVGPIDLRFDKKRGVWVGGSGGGSPIIMGKFCNQWPSLSNVKDPKNAVKKVVLYEISDEDCAEPCPWNLQPQMTTISGVEVPVIVEAINLFSNVAAAEYQTKWCALLQNGGNYYLLAAEC